jgi:hypothetical protein
MNPNLNLLTSEDSLALVKFACLRVSDYAGLRILQNDALSDSVLMELAHKEMDKIKRQLVDIPWAMEFIK